jgi:uncharacterized protein
MKRREALQSLGAAMLGWPLTKELLAAAESQATRKILVFSRSVLFEHSVVHRENGELSFAEKALVDTAQQVGCTADCTKDGSVFERNLDEYAAVVSYTCGNPIDLRKSIPADGRDGNQPLTESGWRKLDAAVRGGKPFVAIHPGIWMLPDASGADCLGHGTQQAARIRVVSPRFPGVEQIGESFTLLEEWFSLIRFNKDLHVILVQDCEGMNTSSAADRRCYDRPPFPATWARMHGKGRVFYTSLGHREDVWSTKIFRQIFVGGLSWALGLLKADIPPNLDQVAPHANDFPKL